MSSNDPRDVVLLAHGSGGTMSHELVEKRLLAHISNPTLARLEDAAVLTCQGRIAFTTDSYVVSPIIFPGGDIGRLAVCGTVNDLAMMGAQPVAISLALIVEEGLPFATLDTVMRSVRAACDEAGVQVVTGDTKVVNRGKADGLFITTSGIGVVPDGLEVSSRRAQRGDRILVSGTLAEHGVAIMSAREGLSFSTTTLSDCAPLNGLVRAMIDACPDALHCMRDPTRGGIASTLNELATQSEVSIVIDEDALPVQPEVRSACEMLGLDPLYVANEGKLVAIVAPEYASTLLKVMRAHPLGQLAVDLGQVVDSHPGRVMLRTRLGPTRMVQMLAGELLPRIC
ncbi:MAG: hydrogenase expression/formation protein HypE [Dehalococcoidia bacterium]|nr:MAG: hydrogenase expression/formation protein HypE [Dehalococcoidia bacterium]